MFALGFTAVLLLRVSVFWLSANFPPGPRQKLLYPLIPLVSESVNTASVFPYWHNQVQWCWCSDMCSNRRLIIRTQLLLCFCTTGEAIGDTPCFCRKSSAYRMTVNMIAWPSLFNLYYPVENGSPAGSNYLHWLGGWGARGPAEIKAARALSSGKKEKFALPCNQDGRHFSWIFIILENNYSV